MLLWISGQSGAGKTTLGHNLSSQRGFVHFDGDVYFSGGDPVTEAGQYIGHGRASDELKSQWRIVTENYDALFDGRAMPVEWAPALGGICAAVAEKARKEDRLVVTFSLYTREMRKWVEECVIEEAVKRGAKSDEIRPTFVVLNDVDGAAAKRKLAQTKSAAEAQGKTMEEFVGQYGKEWRGDEWTLKELSRAQNGFEPGVEAEGEVDVRVKESEDAKAVMEKVVSRLGLRKD